MGNNNIYAEFRVLVERVGAQSKGKKFYAGFSSLTEATECASKMNEAAKHEHENGKPLFEYTVEKNS